LKGRGEVYSGTKNLNRGEREKKRGGNYKREIGEEGQMVGGKRRGGEGGREGSTVEGRGERQKTLKGRVM